MKRTASLLALVGVALLAQGLWIPAKAALAQVLLERAWSRVRGGEEAVRPWPWADTWPVARLSVPGSGVRVLVLSGATGRTLAFGPGHLAGHRDTHFRFLRDLGEGDEVRVERRDGATRSYRVVAQRVVHERDASVLAPDAAGRLTLVTCWPFDAPLPGGPLRYVVVAEAVRDPAPRGSARGSGPAGSRRRRARSRSRGRGSRARACGARAR